MKCQDIAENEIRATRMQRIRATIGEPRTSRSNEAARFSRMTDLSNEYMCWMAACLEMFASDAPPVFCVEIKHKDMLTLMNWPIFVRLLPRFHDANRTS